MTEKTKRGNDGLPKDEHSRRTGHGRKRRCGKDLAGRGYHLLVYEMFTST